MLFDSSDVTVFFFNDTATTEIYTLSLHDALPISAGGTSWPSANAWSDSARRAAAASNSPHASTSGSASGSTTWRSEEHTSELQSRQYLVCRLLLEKKKKRPNIYCVVLHRHRIREL